MVAKMIPCPSCGLEVTRQLTRKELRERNGGQDPVVVVMPRICPACAHVWEPPLSRGMCYLVAAVTGIGFLIGAVIFLGAVWLLVQSKFAPAEGANTLKNQAAVAGFALVGLALATGAGAMCRKYLRLARGNGSTPNQTQQS
jgi:hypothetical protein